MKNSNAFSRQFVLLAATVVTALSATLWSTDFAEAVGGAKKVEKEVSSDTAPAAKEDASPYEQVLADPAALKAGTVRFAQNCAYCHGNAGSGGKAKTLQCRKRLTPEYVFEVITKGKKRGSLIMPPWEDTFNDQERWELTGYIMSFQKLPACSQ